MRKRPGYLAAPSARCALACTGRAPSCALNSPKLVAAPAVLSRRRMKPYPPTYWKINMSDSPKTPNETGSGPCPGLGEALSAYLDNELDSQTRRSVEQHLQGCRRCSVEIAELRQVKRFLAPSSPLAPGLPAGLADRVRSHTYGSGSAGSPTSSVARAWPRAPIYVGGAALLLLAIGILSALWANPFEQSRA